MAVPVHASIRVGGARFRVVQRGSSTRRYIHIHGNEATAREILIEHMRTASGVAFLVEGNDRYVPANSGKLDPNRMFSRVGAEQNLRRLNPGWSRAQVERILDGLDRDLPRLLRRLLPPDGGLLMSLHNNSEGYSIRDETGISDRVSLKEPDRPHEFFLCTDPLDFERLAASPYNVVLQQKAPPDDDGSLSRLCALRGVRYVNLECGLGRAAEQRERLAWAESHLS